jgi:hypothetical protein
MNASRVVPTVTAALCLLVVLEGTAAAQHLGSQDLEPGLKRRGDIVFFEDFQEPDWYTHWGLSSAPADCSLVSNPSYRGRSSLRVHVAQGEHYGVSLNFAFADQGLAEPEEIYFRYYMYFGSNWARDGGEVGKLPGFGGTYGAAGWGGRPSHGDDGWSARMMNRDCTDTILVGYYCYHADMTGTYGDHLMWETDNLGHLQKERWYCIECYARMNTITGGAGNSDGVLRGWIDGRPAFEKTDLRFRDTDTLKIETVWFNIYVGGSWTAPQDMDVYFDNIVIARNPIGVFKKALPVPEDDRCGSCSVARRSEWAGTWQALGWLAGIAIVLAAVRTLRRRYGTT